MLCRWKLCECGIDEITLGLSARWQLQPQLGMCLRVQWICVVRSIERENRSKGAFIVDNWTSREEIMFSTKNGICVVLVVLQLWLQLAAANPDAKRLYDDLLSNYNRLIRPVSNNTETVLVKLGLRLSQLIDLVWKTDGHFWNSQSVVQSICNDVSYFPFFFFRISKTKFSQLMSG